MENYFRKYSYQIQVLGGIAYLALILFLYFRIPDAKVAQRAVNIIALVSLVLSAAIAFWTHRTALEQTGTRKNRLNLAIGLGLWSMAQIIWFLFPGILTYWGTYLSLADLLWYAGSFVLLRVLVFQEDPRTRQQNNSTVVSISIATMILTAIPLFISFPALFSDGGSNALGYLVRIAYLGLTLALAVFAGFALTFKNLGLSGAARKAIYSTFIAWALTAFAQYFFVWVSPLPGKLAFIPNMIFGGIYLILTANIYITWILEQESGLGTKLKLGLIGKDREIPLFLLHTDDKGVVINVSSNFLQFTNNSLPERYLGKSLRDVLGFSDQDFDRISETCARGAFIVQEDIRVAAGQKAPVPLFFTAAGSITGNVYFGMDIILHLPNYSGSAYPLDPESNAIAQRILQRTGQFSRENGSILAEYFIAHIRVYKDHITQILGNKTADLMDKDVNNLAQKNKWPIRLNGLDLDIEPGADNFDNAELIKAMQALFIVAQQFAKNNIGSDEFTRLTAQVNESLGSKIARTARQFGMR